MHGQHIATQHAVANRASTDSLCHLFNDSSHDMLQPPPPPRPGCAMEDKVAEPEQRRGSVLVAKLSAGVRVCVCVRRQTGNPKRVGSLWLPLNQPPKKSTLNTHAHTHTHIHTRAHTHPHTHACTCGSKHLVALLDSDTASC